jgi:hypothetical protein
MSGHTRTIRVDTLARVEGEGALYIKLAGKRVADVKLKIYEPPRFFEANMGLSVSFLNAAPLCIFNSTSSSSTATRLECKSKQHGD